MSDEFEKKEFDGMMSTENTEASSDTANDESEYFKKQEKEFNIDISSITDDIPDYDPNKPQNKRHKAPKYDAKADRMLKKGTGCFTTSIYTIVVLVVSVLLASFVLVILNDMLGLMKNDEDIIINIPEGATISEVADMLQDMDIIDAAIGLKLYANISGKSDLEIASGDITVNPKMGYSSLLKAIKKTNVKEVVSVTIIEGKTIKQIAEQLEEKGVCKAEDFLKEIQTGDFSSFDFVKAIPENEDRIYALEGYIFPDTYDFYKDDSAENVIKKFLNNFNSRFSDDLRALAEDKGMTIDEVVNLASIVQKEGTSAPVMKYVASVFHNRLNNSSSYPYLQSNATLSYSTGKPIIWYTEEDIALDDPYNSYKYKGLPPSAICNPGLDAIKAVLMAEDTDYYFFVTDDDGLYYFSETSKRHEQQVDAIKETGSGLEGTALLI